jgi:hypothetical protein
MIRKSKSSMSVASVIIETSKEMENKMKLEKNATLMQSINALQQKDGIASKQPTAYLSGLLFAHISDKAWQSIIKTINGMENK